MAETQGPPQGPPPGAPQGPPPHPLFLERMDRIQTAIHCGTPDRVPLSLVLDTFACNTMGVKYSEFCADLDVAGQTMLAATEKLGDVDSVQWASYAPAILGMVWLSPMRLPGRERILLMQPDLVILAECGRNAALRILGRRLAQSVLGNNQYRPGRCQFNSSA